LTLTTAEEKIGKSSSMDNSVFGLKASFGNVQQQMDKLILQLKVDWPVHKVAIKVNLCDYRMAESGATSDPRVVKALVLSIFRHYNNPEVAIVETDSSGTRCEALFSILGFRALEQQLGVSLVNLRKTQWQDFALPGLHFSKLKVPTPVIESDLVINHPKMKTHGKTKITIGLKNMFGCVRDKYKARYHPYLDNVIVDVNRAVRSDNIIVDGIIAMEGWGPTYGTPKKAGLLIGGRNPVSVDAFCAFLMGFDPKSVKHVALAERIGLGTTSYNLQGEFDSKSIREQRFKFDFARYHLTKRVEGQIA